MANIVEPLLEILRNDATIASLLPGGLYSDPIDVNDPVTSAAFDDTSSAFSYIRPCAVMLEPQEVDRFSNVTHPTRMDSVAFPDLYVYAERDQIDATFDAVDERAMTLLHGKRFGLTLVQASPTKGAKIPADELPGDVWQMFRRFRVELTRHFDEVI